MSRENEGGNDHNYQDHDGDCGRNDVDNQPQVSGIDWWNTDSALGIEGVTPEVKKWRSSK